MKNIKKVVRWVVNKLLFKVTIYNNDILNSDQKLIICPNHSTVMDGIIMWANNDNVKIMAKKELFENKVIAKILLENGVFPIHRQIFGLNAIKDAINVLKRKDNTTKLIVFPQGTTCFGSVEDSVSEVKKGVSFISRKTNVPLLPTYITEEYKLFQSVDIVYGDIYYPAGNSTNHSQMHHDMDNVAQGIIKCKNKIKSKIKRK